MVQQIINISFMINSHFSNGIQANQATVVTSWYAVAQKFKSHGLVVAALLLRSRATQTARIPRQGEQPERLQETTQASRAGPSRARAVVL